MVGCDLPCVSSLEYRATIANTKIKPFLGVSTKSFTWFHMIHADLGQKLAFECKQTIPFLDNMQIMLIFKAVSTTQNMSRKNE